MISRRCIPYTPNRRSLAECTVALATTAGVHLKSQAPYDLEGDATYRMVPGDAPSGELMITHGHYDHADADRDINCVFPIDRLRELAAEGVIGGVGNKHIGAMGYTPRLQDFYERLATGHPSGRFSPGPLHRLAGRGGAAAPGGTRRPQAAGDTAGARPDPRPEVREKRARLSRPRAPSGRTLRGCSSRPGGSGRRPGRRPPGDRTTGTCSSCRGWRWHR